jgi:hypothetical protein
MTFVADFFRLGTALPMLENGVFQAEVYISALDVLLE